jgi:2-polyprenyl-3-methyl-5-hydroxy-6-metoxy-1,4-benzoquinol methylase
MTQTVPSSCLLCGESVRKKLFIKGGKTFVRCSHCGLVWLEPLPTAADIAGYYARAYAEGIYAPFAGAEEIRRIIAEHRLEIVRPLARPGRWLDVGCSTGHFVEAAAQAGIEAEGIDASPRAVELARARGLKAFHAQGEDFQPPNQYDTITAFDVIEHTRDPGAFLSGLRRWIDPGGTLILTLPDVASIYPRLLMRRHWFYYAPNDHLFYFTPRTIAQLLVRHGFSVRRITRAYKPLTLDYIVSQLPHFNPTLGRVVRLATRALPRRLTARRWRFYVGEMMAIATRGE